MPIGILIIIAFLIFCYADTPSSSSSFGNTSTDRTRNSYNQRQGTSYNSGTGERDYYDGGSSIQEGSVSYYAHGGRSVQSGNITYYFDAAGNPIGRSVQHGMVTTYLDETNREIGRTVDNGNGVYDHFGDTFTDI